MSCTLWATQVKIIVRFFLKLLCYEEPALLPSYGHMYRWPFFAHVHYTYKHAHTDSLRAEESHISAFQVVENTALSFVFDHLRVEFTHHFSYYAISIYSLVPGVSFDLCDSLQMHTKLL